MKRRQKQRNITKHTTKRIKIRLKKKTKNTKQSTEILLMNVKQDTEKRIGTSSMRSIGNTTQRRKIKKKTLRNMKRLSVNSSPILSTKTPVSKTPVSQ
jgi:hypothetical protein